MKKNNLNKILLIATRQIGDVLLMTPLLRSLRQAYSHAIIDVLVYTHKGGMLAGNPDYNELISVAEHPNFKEYLQLLRRIGRRYDLAISTLSGDRPLIYSMIAAPQRIAVVPPWHWQSVWKRWCTQAWTELDNEQTHTVVQNLRLADLLGIKRHYPIVLPQASAKPKLPWSHRKFAVLHLLPMWHYKRWTIQGFSEIISYLTQMGLGVVITGGNGKQETQYIQKVLEHAPPTVVNLAGQLSLAEVATMIQHAQVYVGPDTAVTHLAAATGTPTVALYGPTNPLKWAPWPYGYAADSTPFKRQGSQQVGNVLLIQAPGSCVPCHQEGCDRHKASDSRCLQHLASTTVIEAVQRFT